MKEDFKVEVPLIGQQIDIDKSIEEFDALKMASRKNND